MSFDPTVCPHCGGGKRSCDLLDETGGVCPWEESGEMDEAHELAAALKEDDDD